MLIKGLSLNCQGDLFHLEIILAFTINRLLEGKIGEYKKWSNFGIVGVKYKGGVSL